MRPAYIALGSNIGNRSQNITKAVQLLNGSVGRVTNTSFLYETSPQLYLDQPDFLNAACELQTNLSPHELLQQVKGIELQLGRAPDKERYGPRSVDLDVVLLGPDEVVDDKPTLSIPHERLVERNFVLRPLCDMNEDLIHPTLGQTVGRICADLDAKGGDGDPMKRVLPMFSNHQYNETVLPWSPSKQTYIMGILNITPDSFSDGGTFIENGGVCMESIVTQVKAMVRDGVDIIDVGGESTRPGAKEVDEEEEIERVVPVIRAIRHESDDVLISVDTRKAKVAAAALQNGANLLNDVSGGSFDPDMLPTAAEYGAPIVLMHMKGTPETMNHMANYSSGVVQDVKEAFDDMTMNAIRAGVPRWNIVLDPGIGFAKTGEQNMEILKHFSDFTKGDRAQPTLLGTSRKRFLGHFTGKEVARDRDYATAATTAIGIQAGVTMVRVHNVPATSDVRAICDPTWK